MRRSLLGLGLAALVLLAACSQPEPTATPVLVPEATRVTAAAPIETPVPAPTPTPIPSVDRGALVALYRAAGGENWKNNDNWVSGAPIGQWYRVMTDSYDRVIGLRLNENGLIGEIPSELGNLTALEALALRENRLTGEMPSELGSLPYLEDVWLAGSNRLTGCIPRAWRDLQEGDVASLGLEYCRER